MADWKGREPVAEKVAQLVGSWDLGWAARKGAAWADYSGNTMVWQMAVLLAEWMADRWVEYSAIYLVDTLAV